ncbi:MAG: glutathione synthase [Gammaproteobacteria bacterium]|nr:glutathione synthase [Gammaproteobacteria bacterium]
MTAARWLGVVMDPIESIKPAKDTTLAMMLEAQRRGWRIAYMQQRDLYLRDGSVRAHVTEIRVEDSKTSWWTGGEGEDRALASLDVVLMRKDPPFDIEYVYTTHLLELAEAEGVLVVNRPQALRDYNEKLATAWFPQCCVPTLVSRDDKRIRAFLEEQGDIIVKPLSAMGGASVFRLRKGDPNIGVIMETMTDYGHRYTMAQTYIPEITSGDKRILLIDGEPVSHALARLPNAGETRANLAAGGRGVAQPLSERDRWICAQVGPRLRELGLMFVGLDVIGDFLTEINVTSPTCVREIDSQCGTNICATLFDRIEVRLERGN